MEARNKPDREAAIERFLAKVQYEPNTGCWLWAGALMSSGYGHMLHEGRYIGTHRLAYKLFVGDIPDGLVICHRCDVKPCVNPDHLWAGTTQENLIDCRDKGRLRPGRQPGEMNPKARLTEAEVIEIRSAPREYGSRPALAARYGVSVGMICQIRGGRAWKHLKEMAL